MRIDELTAAELAEHLRSRRLSAAEVVRHFNDQIDRLDPQLHAFLHRTRPLAETAAVEADRRLGAGTPAGPLDGVPIALKDNISVAGFPTSCGSHILENYFPPFDAGVTERLRAGGLPIMGKTNLDEFAMGSSTEHSAFQPSSNPWDTDRVPGGSSGGSAAAVAAGLVPVALGSDTGGSVRQPAALCGVVGLKPTYGAVSRYGLVAYASSLDQIGPLARTAEDCALLFAQIAGKDSRDSTSMETSHQSLMDTVRTDARGLKIGIAREMLGEGVGEETRKAVLAAADTFRELGCVVGETSLPHMHYSIPTYYVIACAEASSNLARYDGVRYGLRSKNPSDLIQMFEETRASGFGAEAKRRIMLGTFVLSSGYYDAYYGRAQKARTLIKGDFTTALEQFDVLLGATAPTPAFRKGEKSQNPLEMYAADICTVSLNLAGNPGLSVPCGFSAGELPIGLQLIGRPFQEATLLQLGYNYQRVTDFHKRRPRLQSSA